MTDGLTSPLKIDPPKGKKNGRLPKGVPTNKSSFEPPTFKPGQNEQNIGDALYRLSPEEIALQKERKALEEKESQMRKKKTSSDFRYL